SASFSKIDYAVTTATGLTGGSVSADATAQYQDQVTITATPAVGYKLDAITVKDASNNAVAVTNGKFTMPASAVNVTASFSPTGYVENGQVYGDWVVTSDYTIAEGETLVIPAGTTVTTYGGAVIINNGTLKVEDEISGVTLAGDGVFNYTTLDKYDVTFGTATYNGSAITIGNGLDVTYATKTFCGKTFTFDAESCTITYTNNVNASVGTRYAVVTWDFSGNTATKEFAILKRELNLTGFIANNKNYDGTTQATGSFSDDRIAGDELEFNYKCAFEDENVGTGKNVSFYRIEIDGGADADNYELVTTEGSASANINKAPLTIKANDFTINVGDEMPTFTVEYDGFVAAQNVEVLSTLPTVGVDITETSVAGTYDIIVSGAVADSYEITYINGTLTINPATATAIDEVASADVKIYSRGNIIVVENADSPIEVFDISGKRVERQSEILSRVEIPMSDRGVFVVRTGNTSQKVIVK
ncbi:MAG: YDG domain-containing protein, partial [Bacteroidales bacterium]|nr:YDG domain-containing protein [Bacteroidales bacterium]